jgi:hypothetical protein
MNNKHEYQAGESYQEEEQEVSNIPPTLENYNPEGDIPFMPSMPQRNIKQPEFLDLSNPQNLAGNNPNSNANPNKPKTNPYTQYKDNIGEKSNKPNFESAENSREELGTVFDKINKISAGTQKGETVVNRYAINEVIKALHNAINKLKEVDYWIPVSKEEYSPKLKKIAEPIVNAMSAYVNKIEKLK